MAGLTDRKILVGVAAGIAAYKSVELVRRLRERGAVVRVAMTPSAESFITPLTLHAVSGFPVVSRLLDPQAEDAMEHINLARWADVVLVAPATANFMARLACGLADDVLVAMCLATRAPLFLAPAMNKDMWSNPATQANRRVLNERGIQVLGPGEGSQACGEVGVGRMLEPDRLIDELQSRTAGGRLEGVCALVTAGPTREPVDPVRFLGNRSSGRMGYAMASALRDQGARVTLVSGPVAQDPPPGMSSLIRVETAGEMHRAVMAEVGSADLFVAVAAVADYRPCAAAATKIKKDERQVVLRLERNPDILAWVAAQADAPFTVGFAAETENLEEYAERKRSAKGVDMIAANLVGAPEGGFERDQNALLVMWEGGSMRLPMMAKRPLADRLVGLIGDRYDEKNPGKNP